MHTASLRLKSLKTWKISYLIENILKVASRPRMSVGASDQYITITVRVTIEFLQLFNNLSRS